MENTLNSKVVGVLNEIADLYDLKGEVFKRNAYRKAAQSVERLDGDISTYYHEGKLTSIVGVGEGIAKKIAEVIETGTSSHLKELEGEFPPGLEELIQIPEVGPKTAVRLNKELGIGNLMELKIAVEQHRIRRLKGFGPRSEESMMKGIALVERQSGRMLLGMAYPVAVKVRDHLIKECGCEMVSLAGSLRRMKETIGDIDILVGSNDPGSIMKAFVSYPGTEDVLSKGTTRSSIRLNDGTQVDIRVVGTDDYGAALMYFTGSKDHNVELRRIAIQKGYKLNEYGVFRKDDNTKLVAVSEEDIYHLLGLKYIPPEMREMRGEIEASRTHSLPKLVRKVDIKGDFHCHTIMSDGSATLEEMALAAKHRGYEYIGLTDHSQSLHIAKGVPIDRLLESCKEAHALSDKIGIRVMRGAEVDILEDGSLDYPNDVLEQLDYAIGSVHTHWKMSRMEMTNRVIKAVSNENIKIIGHPTGRLIGKRDPYEIDLEPVMDAARDNKVFMELNGFPDRLDLNDENCLKAKKRGVVLSIGTDAHSPGQLENMTFAVATARRGWLEAKDVLNTRSVKEIETIFGL